jgi:hypothetical protein
MNVSYRGKTLVLEFRHTADGREVRVRHPETGETAIVEDRGDRVITIERAENTGSILDAVLKHAKAPGEGVFAYASRQAATEKGRTPMLACDVCGTDTPWNETTVYTHAEFDRLRGMMGTAFTRKMIERTGGAGFTRRQMAVLPQMLASHDWALCAVCTAAASRRMPVPRKPGPRESPPAAQPAIADAPSSSAAPKKWWRFWN